jgi:hypothetical protein
VNSFAFIGFTFCGAILPSCFQGVNVSTTPEGEGQFQIFQSNRGILSGVIGSHDTEVRLRIQAHGYALGRSLWPICPRFSCTGGFILRLAYGQISVYPSRRRKNGSIVRLGEDLVPPTFLRSIEDSGFSTWLRESESPFAFYFVLLFHTFGLALLVGANAVMDLRILGVAREIPLAPLKRLFRIMWIGFGINAFTGVLLILAYPTKALTNPVFYTKLTLIALAIWIITLLRDRVFGDASLDETAMMARGATLAKWSLFLWVGAISAGRLLAYTYRYLTYPC